LSSIDNLLISLGQVANQPASKLTTKHLLKQRHFAALVWGDMRCKQRQFIEIGSI